MMFLQGFILGVHDRRVRRFFGAGSRGGVKDEGLK
jgi:hypothetical protein